MVIDRRGQFKGVIQAATAANEKNRNKDVGSVMQKDCITISSNESIVDVLNITKEKNNVYNSCC